MCHEISVGKLEGKTTFVRPSSGWNIKTDLTEANARVRTGFSRLYGQQPAGLLVPTSRDLCRTMITGAEQLITNLHAISTLRMSGAIPPLTHVPSWSDKDFTNIEKTLPITNTKVYYIHQTLVLSTCFGRNGPSSG